MLQPLEPRAPGRLVVVVDPKHASPRCSVCGLTDPENRSEQAVFRCLSCGHSENADVNAARNILAAVTQDVSWD